jgi:TRAP-type C4-dicarboxylate transport system permease small subunit
LYCAVLPAPWLVRTRGHVFVEAFITMMGRPLRRAVETFIYAACIIAALVFCYYSAVKLAHHLGTGEYETRSVDMPLWLLYLPMPFSFFLVAVEFGRFLFGAQSMYSSPARKGD